MAGYPLSYRDKFSSHYTLKFPNLTNAARSAKLAENQINKGLIQIPRKRGFWLARRYKDTMINKAKSYIKIWKRLKRLFRYRMTRRFLAITVIGVVNVFNLAIAAAPVEPLSPNQEGLALLSSLTAESALESPYNTIIADITAYSSTPDQTDDTPFVTASNTRARDGVVAANFLIFGTKIKIPELFGEKVFTVEDRMHSRFDDRIDIWFPNRASAAKFGIKKQVKVMVL